MLREGESFAAGQTLVRLDCTLHEIRLEKAEALLLEAENIEEVSARLDKLGSISTVEFSNATARLAAASAEVELMRGIVERCVIKAPFQGKIVELMARSHQFVAEGQELLEILDDSVMLVEMNVPSQWLERSISGRTATLSIDETRKEYPAIIERVGARIDPVSQSVKLYGNVVGMYPELRSGMSGTAVFSDQ
jgi:multidrug resistance efflux pump